MHTAAVIRRYAAQQSVAGQQDCVIMATCGDEAEAVIGRELRIARLDGEGFGNPFGRQIEDRDTRVQHRPFLRGEPDQFGFPNGQGNDQPVTVLGMVADMELTFIRDRQRAGIEVAKQKGAYKGRQKKVEDLKIKRLAAEGVTKAQIARDLGVSRMTVYRALEASGTKADVEIE
ncbi:helix-turn-helix domain-containing protein [Paracoccus sp. R12_1]|uniref:helix-turn-helix domain-containing protein n=2 Tax=Paracoccus TaxID=265 RepID=UPI0032AF2F19